MKCPICGVRELRPPLYFQKFYRTCSNCSGHFIEKDVKTKYPKKYFKETSDSKFFSAGQIIINLFLQARVSFIKKIIKSDSAKILDYGCGRGSLVKALISSGYHVIGFEPSAGARKIAKEEKLPIYKNVRKISGGYDLIMFWQSLEHTPDPLRVMTSSKRFLSKNGKILIAVPNAESFEAKFCGEKWFHLTYPLHKIQFTPQSIQTMLNKSGLKLENIDYFNPEYTFSGLVQTLLNFFLPKDVLYSAIANRRSTMSKNKAILYATISLFLVLTFLPVILLIFFLELLFKKTDAILVTACK